MAGLTDRRGATRIDKIFRVSLATEEHGELWYLARNISATGMLVEMAEPLPLRTKVIVRFAFPGDDASICAIARVQNHYYFQYAEADEIRGLTGIGVRFLRFVPEAGAGVTEDRLH